MKMLRSKVVFCTTALLAAGSVMSASAGTIYPIPDGTSDSFFDQMKNALAKCTANAWDEIVIAAGTYQLGEDDCSSKNDGKVSAFETPVNKVIIRGATGNPADVVIKGGGKYRFFYSNNKYLTVRDLTFTDFDNSSYPGSQEGGSVLRNYQNDAQKYAYIVTSNCVFKNCTSTVGAVHSATVYGCTFMTNVATKSSGGAYAVACYDSWFEGNTAGTLGGGIGYPKAVSNCVFVSNRCNAYEGGAIGSNSGEVFDSYFTNNVAKRGGGAVNGGTVRHCVFSGNESQESSGNFSGGGAMSVTAYDCFFTNNVSSKGGGALYKSTAYKCEIVGNRSPTGGGVYETDIYGCQLVANKSTSYGGGARGCTVVSNCVFLANESDSSGGATYACSPIDCAFTNNTAGGYGGAVYGRSVIGCSFGMNYTPGSQQKSGHYLYQTAATNCVFDGENVDLQTSAQSSYGMFNECPSFVNCLFKNFNVYSVCRAETDISFVNCLFANVTSSYVTVRTAKTKDLNFVNCTVADCEWADTGFAYGNDISIGNSIFYGNTTAGVRDDLKVALFNSGVCSGSHNCYGVAAAFPVTGDDNFQVSTVNFVGEGAHPYQLAYRQKDARVKNGGAVGAWTAADKDLAGNPRLHTDPVTIGLGCYECWAKPSGLSVIVR